MKQEETKIQTQTTTENRLTTYLSLRGFHIETININGSIKFEVSGKGLDQAIRDFYSNPEVRLFDYFRHFDLIREMIRGGR